jgi:hypothetical protein
MRSLDESEEGISITISEKNKNADEFVIRKKIGN